MRVPTLAVLLLLGLVPGCFAFDEIDKGMKDMERHSGGGAAEPESRPAEPVPPGATPGQDRSESGAWWQKARVLAPRDASQDLVRCDLAGKTQFMRSTDCQVRGGSVREAPGG